MSSQLNQIGIGDFVHPLFAGGETFVVKAVEVVDREKLFAIAMNQSSVEEAKKLCQNAVNVGAIGHVNNGKKYLSECIAKELSKGKL